MDKPLSFSGYKRFIECPQFYKYHDVDKDRPGRDTSALLFGGLMDDVLNELLLNDGIDTASMISKLIAGHMEKDIDFFEIDYDDEILPQDQRGALVQHAKDLGWKGEDFPGMIKSMLKAQSELSANQKIILRSACWLSMEVKANLFITSYRKWILPKIDKVHDIQKELTYTFPADPNTGFKGGTTRGFLDFTATLNDGRRVLFDNKTAKYAYGDGAALLSPQLALYAHIEGYDHVGFIVMNKGINKNKVKTCKVCGVSVKGGKLKSCGEKVDGVRCGGEFDVQVKPTAYVQFQVEKIPQINKDLIVGALRDSMTCIDNGIFPRNLTNCNNRFGKPCVYFKKCWEK